MSHPPSHPPLYGAPTGSFVRSDGVFEKRTPDYPLAHVQQLVRKHGTGVFGFNAMAGVAAMQLQPHQAIAAILALRPVHFFKSMTAENDATHTLWQDVYHGPTDNGLAYIKFMLWVPPAASKSAVPPSPKLVISFKKL
ncbi:MULTISPECIES: type II toxin-antitoxin system MqsR family toxin [Stenotrophomonas]|uniref:Type II toxin-antitoxin system MqsR family toxin n=1 Tax=Stenotrophomonas aracearum TaxID=3003272 RepID=A0ABY9Y958_9GAMM|nr:MULTISPECIES: type II toxin-antitoxin system MqsR family toxin [unclassified Stenotrophomonas]WNH47212.1 type II toxin-antitoxin system MqsR family toxin [Stenotrophomonas sp. A5588]